MTAKKSSIRHDCNEVNDLRVHSPTRKSSEKKFREKAEKKQKNHEVRLLSSRSAIMK